ncbi:MAG TPA: hypothetical protein PLB32_18230, partial [Acidobacteriota bacterium]|nr:hypothetical protein [Acidobacteriota bacterium]
MRLTENLSSRAKRLTGFLMVLTLLGFAAMPFLPAPSSLASSGKGLINKLIAPKKQEPAQKQESATKKEATSEEKTLTYDEIQKIKEDRVKEENRLADEELAKRGFFIPTVAVNDMCAGAVNIVDTGTYPILSPLTNISGATGTSDPGTSSCASGNTNRGVWYTFTPTTSQNYRFSTVSTGGTSFLTNTTDFFPAPTFNSAYIDSVLAVFTSSGGCGGTFTQVTGACNDDSGAAIGGQSELSVALTSGTTYYILVYRFGSGAAAAPDPISGMQVYVTTGGAPTNDTCSSPQTLTLGQIVPGSTGVGPASPTTTDHYRVSASDPNWSVGGSGNNSAGITAPGPDVVYQFTPASTGDYSFAVTNGSGVTASTPGNITTY